ncbi:MAG: hypothetical protein ABSA02_39935, partial [Trebonia sp.]
RRAGFAVVLNPPPAEGGFSPNRADGPLVLTEHGQLKQLSAIDFPVPAEPVEHLRIPGSFSERSPKHRRDLVSSMRSKIAGRDFDYSPRRGRTVGGANDNEDERTRDSASPARDSAHGGGGSRGRSASNGRGYGSDGDGSRDRVASTGPESDGGDDWRDRAATVGRRAEGADDRDAPVNDIDELRRQLRRHPCHSCQDREQHARVAERYFRQQKELEDLERQINSRSHVIARTFDRVCAVLDELGYLDGDTVTPDGQRLSRLYSELDLVAAECIRRGLWDGLNPAELAACVSVLSFESRKQQDDAEPVRLPKGPVRDVLTEMGRTWAELDQLERRNGVSFLREPDSGFVWAAYRWVRGVKLEDVLDSVPGLTPGDFVRSVKQLIDLLDQIAAAASYDAKGNAAARAKPRSVTQEGLDLPRPPAEDAEEGAGEPAPATASAATGTGVPSREPAPRQRDVAATARAAIDAMRRGVIAYTNVAV